VTPSGPSGCVTANAFKLNFPPPLFIASTEIIERRPSMSAAAFGHKADITRCLNGAPSLRIVGLYWLMSLQSRLPGMESAMAESEHELDVRPRRRVLRLVALASFCLPFAGRAALAAEGNNATEGGAWLLGDNLSLAALLYNQGAAAETVDRYLAKAKAIADIFGVQIKPFPAKSAIV
jgi:hypothetical protein